MVDKHGGWPDPDQKTNLTFRLLVSFSDCLIWQVDEPLRMEMVQLVGRVLGDREEEVR